MMKNLKTILLVLASSCLLASCNQTPASGPSEAEEIRKTDVLVEDPESDKIVSTEVSLDLLFKAKSEIPYVSIDDGFKFLNYIKAVHFNDKTNKDHFFKVTRENEDYVVADEAGTKVTFSQKNQTIVYDDFDSFLYLGKDATNKPLTLNLVKKDQKALKITKSEYKKGNAVTVNLKSYEGIDLYRYGNSLYLPLVTFNDFFFNVFEYSNLAYNYKDVYVVPYGGLVNTMFGEPMLTTLGNAFFKGPKKATLSAELKNFHLQEACLNFDYLYGLKKEKGFTNFSSFLESKGLKEEVASEDTKKADSALRYALSHLVDGHTLGTITSPLYDWGTATDDASRMNAERAAWIKSNEALADERVTKKTAPLGNHLNEIGKTYYIAFNSFTPLNEDLLYLPATEHDESTVMTNTALQFNEAYKYLMKDENKAKINNIVVDIATNDGGASDSLLFALSTLLGEVKTAVYDSLSGAENRTSYKADINLDGVIDDKDVPLISKGYNIVFLDSKATFSSANAMPAIAKYTNSKVMTVGETTGGGTCAVRPSFSALGASLSSSGLATIAVEKNGKLENLEKGVAPDNAIARESLFDRDFIATMINVWTGK